MKSTLKVHNRNQTTKSNHKIKPQKRKEKERMKFRKFVTWSLSCMMLAAAAVCVGPAAEAKAGIPAGMEGKYIVDIKLRIPEGIVIKELKDDTGKVVKVTTAEQTIVVKSFAGDTQEEAEEAFQEYWEKVYGYKEDEEGNSEFKMRKLLEEQMESWKEAGITANVPLKVKVNGINQEMRVEPMDVVDMIEDLE